MKDGMRACSRMCRDLGVECDQEECRMWIDHPEDNNCTLISIYENGNMTLREVGKRLGISFARVKQIEEKALIKLRRFGIDW
jgi:hypothetical protein